MNWFCWEDPQIPVNMWLQFIILYQWNKCYCLLKTLSIIFLARTIDNYISSLGHHVLRKLCSFFLAYEENYYISLGLNFLGAEEETLNIFHRISSGYFFLVVHWQTADFLSLVSYLIVFKTAVVLVYKEGMKQKKKLVSLSTVNSIKQQKVKYPIR